MELTRQQLYEMVWAEPVTRVAAKVGLSDRGLAKLCARYDIPVPGRGYWARKAFGRTRAPNPLFRQTPNLHTAASTSTSRLRFRRPGEG